MPSGRTPFVRIPTYGAPVAMSAEEGKPPLTDKDYILVGVTGDNSTIVLKRWNHCPSVKDINARMGSAKKDYTGFALCSVSGLYAPSKG